MKEKVVSKINDVDYEDANDGDNDGDEDYDDDDYDFGDDGHDGDDDNGNNSLLNTNTEEANKTGLGRPFQTETIQQMCLWIILYKNMRSVIMR